MIQKIGLDCQRLITDYAWQDPLTFDELLRQVRICEDIQDSVPPALLNPVVFDSLQDQYVPSPFRSGFPFYPVTNLACTTYWNSFLRFLPVYVTGDFLREQKTYRNVFRRLVDKVYRSGFLHFNRLLTRFLIHLKRSDFANHVDLETERLIRQLGDSESLARPSTLV